MPEFAPMKPPAYLDASSAILLYKTDLLLPFMETYEPVITPSVFRELTVPGHAGAGFFREHAHGGSFVFRSPSGNPPADRQWLRLGQGEKETLLVFSEHQDGFIVIDDGKGVAVCRQQGFAHVNALLIPKLLGFSGTLTETESRDAMARVCALGRYSQKVRTVAEELTCRDLYGFLAAPVRNACALPDYRILP